MINHLRIDFIGGEQCDHKVDHVHGENPHRSSRNVLVDLETVESNDAHWTCCDTGSIWSHACLCPFEIIPTSFDSVLLAQCHW